MRTASKAELFELGNEPLTDAQDRTAETTENV